MGINKFSEATKYELGNYVYCLCSVIDNKESVFYIGKGSDDRVFEHENNNYYDLTDKGEKIREIISNGGIIKKYILDYKMENSKDIKGQDIAFHAENALINLAKLTKMDITNSQNGHGMPKRPMTVDEIEKLILKDTVTYDIFNPEDKVMIARFPYNSERIMNNDDKLKEVLYSRRFSTSNEREIPFYCCVVYRSIFRNIFKIKCRKESFETKNKQTRYCLVFTSLEPTSKYNDHIGKSFGTLIPAHTKNNAPIFTYDKFYLNT